MSKSLVLHPTKLSPPYPDGLVHQYFIIIYNGAATILQLELSRAHTPCACTSATVAAMALSQFINLTTLTYDEFEHARLAHGITGCGRKAWPVETRDLQRSWPFLSA